MQGTQFGYSTRMACLRGSVHIVGSLTRTGEWWSVSPRLKPPEQWGESLPHM